MGIQTVSILTRACEAELPYLHAFIAHHIKMGFSQIHIIVQEKSLESKIRDVIDESEVLHFHFISIDITPDDCLREFNYNKITTSYVFLLDIDEFFYSPVFNNIEEVVAELNFPKSIYPFWIMAPSDFDDAERAKGYLGHIGKQIAKVHEIKSLISPHAFKLKNSLFGKQTCGYLTYDSQFFYKPNDCFIIHYWGRTFKDCLIKMLYQHGMDSMRCSTADELIKLAEKGEIPARLKLLAGLNAHPRYMSTPDYLDGRVDYDLEQKFIDKYLNQQQYQLIRYAYENYKKKVIETKAYKHYPSKGELRLFLQSLP